VALAIALSAILVVAAVLPAAADGPVYRGPFDPSPWSFYPDMCSFPVRAIFDESNATETVWVKPNGAVVWRLTGDLQSTWINVETGYSIWQNLPGPVTATTYPDGSLYIFAAGPQSAPFAAPHSFTWGVEKLWVTPEGVLTYTLRGRSEDICALLDH
jgi:hypothetical protein